MTDVPDLPAPLADRAETDPDPRRWWTLGVLCLSLTLVMVSNGSLNVALPSMARELDAASSDLQWIVDSYALVFAGMLFAASTLGDRFGRKGALQLGLGLFLVAAIGGVLADSSGQVIAVRATMGLGAALVMPSTLSILANVFPARERARAISLWAGIAAGGAALGPPTSGLLLEHYWWGSVFLVTLPITALALVAGHRLIPTSRDPAGTRLDIAGAVLSIVAISALVYAIIEAPHTGWSSSTTTIWFTVALVSLAVFVAVETRSSHPMLDLRLFRDRRFSVSSAGIAIAFFTMFGLFFLLTQLFQLVHGLSPLLAGLMILPMSVTLMLVAPRAAGLVERHGAARVVPAGLGVMATALMALALVVRADSIWWIHVATVPLAAGMALTMTPLTSLIMAAVPRSRAGMGSATNDATRELGGALGVAVLGSLTSTVYVRQIPALDHLGSAADEVRGGLAGALELAARTPSAATAQLVDHAQGAFVDGMTTAIVVSAVLAGLAAIGARRMLPRDGLEQPPATLAAVDPGPVAATDR